MDPTIILIYIFILAATYLKPIFIVIIPLSTTLLIYNLNRFTGNFRAMVGFAIGLFTLTFPVIFIASCCLIFMRKCLIISLYLLSGTGFFLWNIHVLNKI